MNFGALARSYNSHLSDLKPTNVDVDWATNRETDIRAQTSELRKHSDLLDQASPLLQFLNKKIADIDGYEGLLREIKGALSELKACSPLDESFDRNLSATRLSTITKKIPELREVVLSFVEHEWASWYARNWQPLIIDETAIQTIRSVHGSSNETQELEKINNTFVALSDTDFAKKTDLPSIAKLRPRFEELYNKYKITMSVELDALLKNIRSPFTTAKLSDLTPELLDELKALGWDTTFKIVPGTATVKL